MKSVSVLSTLLLLTLVLLAVVTATDVEEGLIAAAEDGPTVAAASRGMTLQPGAASDSSDRCLNESELRRIVREELAAYPAAVTAARMPDGPGGDTRQGGAPVGSSEFEQIDQQVDNYIREGAISDAEMIILQAELSRLDPAARRQILGKIVRAMNSGALAGNL